MLTDKMRALISENTIALVATVTPDGHPKVSPKGTTVIIDDGHLAFSHIRSPDTVRNISAHPAVELNFIDVFRRQACRVEGTAVYVARSEERFDELLPLFRKWEALVDRMQGFVVVEISRAWLLRSPAYDVGQEEAELIEQWLGYYTARLNSRS